jgi:hypothetical protein
MLCDLCVILSAIETPDTIQSWMIPRRSPIATAEVRSLAPNFSMRC